MFAVGISSFAVGGSIGGATTAGVEMTEPPASIGPLTSDGVVGDSEPHNTTEIIVTFSNQSVRDETTLTKHNATVVGGADIEFMPVLFVTATNQTRSDIEAEPTVETVTRNTEIDRMPPGQPGSSSENETTVEPAANTPWGVTRIGARDAAGAVPAANQSNTTVAVLDTGIDADHPALEASAVWGANTVGAEPKRGLDTADDDGGHGTRVSGIIAGSADSDVVGVAPDISLYAIKVLDETGSGDGFSLIQGIEIALEGPDGEVGTEASPDVVSMSLGTQSGFTALEETVAHASDHAVVVAAAGNRGDGDPDTNTVAFPAQYDDAIAVAATDKDDVTPTFSAEGDAVELAAPGVAVETTDVGGGTTLITGTSAAAPHVSGTVGLLIAAGADRDTVRPTLQETADPVGSPRTTGSGIVQADAAVEQFSGPPTEPAFFDVTITEAVNATAGEPVGVNATIANTGDVDGTTDITTEIDGIGTSTVSEVFIPANSEISGTFTVATEPTDVGDYTAVISTADTTDTAAVAVLQPTAELDAHVDIADVTAGDSFPVAVTVEEMAGVTAEAVEVSLTVGPDGTTDSEYEQAVPVGDIGMNATTTVTFGGADTGTPELKFDSPGAYNATVEVTAANAEAATTSDSFTVYDAVGEAPEAWTDRGLTDEQFAAVVGPDGEFGRQQMRTAFRAYFEPPAQEINGVAVSRNDMRNIFRFYFESR